MIAAGGSALPRTAEIIQAGETRDRDLRLSVAGKRKVANDVVELRLVDPAGRELPAWTPGSHIDLVLPGAPALVRQYSLCGSPQDRSAYRIAVLREPGGRGGSVAVHDSVQDGDTVTGRGPRNHFGLVPASRYLFVAGGIGITPILPMIEAVAGAGTQWQLLYGGREFASMAYLDELCRFGGHVMVHPQDKFGLLPFEEYFADPSPGAVIYACGPAGMLDAVARATSGWPAGSLHVERFQPVVVSDPAAARPFRVILARSGVELTVAPDQTILDAVEAHGVNVLASCREGTCGTCETTILDGLADHRDSVLSEEDRAEGDALMICVSRAISDRLTLDI